MHLNTAIGNGWLQYAATCVMVLVGVGSFALAFKKIFERLVNKL